MRGREGCSSGRLKMRSLGLGVLAAWLRARFRELGGKRHEGLKRVEPARKDVPERYGGLYGGLAQHHESEETVHEA